MFNADYDNTSNALIPNIILLLFIYSFFLNLFVYKNFYAAYVHGVFIFVVDNF